MISRAALSLFQSKLKNKKQLDKINSCQNSESNCKNKKSQCQENITNTAENSKSQQKNFKKQSIQEQMEIMKDPKKRQQFTNLLLSRLSKLHGQQKNQIKIPLNFSQSYSLPHQSPVIPELILPNLNIKLLENNRQPSISSIDNLLILSKVLQKKPNPQLLKLEIKRQSIKQNINYNKILITFCIEKFISMFYDEHQIGMQVNQLYLFRKIGEYLIKILKTVGTLNWFLIKRIIKIVVIRLGQKMNSSGNQYSEGDTKLQYFADSWILKLLKKKRKQLKFVDIDIQAILQSRQEYIDKNGNVDEYFINQTPKGMKFINFRQQFLNVRFYDSGDEEMHNPEQFDIPNKLKYFQRKQKIQKKIQSKSKQQRGIVETIKEIQKKILAFDKEPLPLEFQIIFQKNKIPQLPYQIYENKNQYEKSQIFDPKFKNKKQIIEQKKKKKKKLEKQSSLIQVSFKKQSKKNLFKKLRKQCLELSSSKIKSIAQQYNIQKDEIIINKEKNLYSSRQTSKIKENSKKFIAHKVQQKSNKIFLRSNGKNIEQNSKDKESCQQNILPNLISSVEINNLIQIIQENLTQFCKNQPQFTLQMLKNEISKLLTKMNIPEWTHKTICDKWLSKFI